MAYDWDGYSTRRTRSMRVVSAVAFGLAVPLMITAWRVYVA